MRRVGLLFMILLLLAPAVAAAQQTTRVPVSADEVVGGDPAEPRIALVFNVGAGYEPATAIIETLATYQQAATFFVMGWWATRHPELLHQIAEAGHEIGSHGDHVF